MDNQIDGLTKKCRVKEVLALSEKYELEYYQKNLNKEYDGIIETRKDNKKIVITSNYLPVEIETNLENNTKVNIILNEVNNSRIIGKIKE